MVQYFQSRHENAFAVSFSGHQMLDAEPGRKKNWSGPGLIARMRSSLLNGFRKTVERVTAVNNVGSPSNLPRRSTSSLSLTKKRSAAGNGITVFYAYAIACTVMCRAVTQCKAFIRTENDIPCKQLVAVAALSRIIIFHPIILRIFTDSL